MGSFTLSRNEFQKGVAVIPITLDQSPFARYPISRESMRRLARRQTQGPMSSTNDRPFADRRS